MAFANEINADITIGDLTTGNSNYHTCDIVEDTVIDLSNAANAENTATQDR